MTHLPEPDEQYPTEPRPLFRPPRVYGRRWEDVYGTITPDGDAVLFRLEVRLDRERWIAERRVDRAALARTPALYRVTLDHLVRYLERVA